MTEAADTRRAWDIKIITAYLRRELPRASRDAITAAMQRDELLRSRIRMVSELLELGDEVTSAPQLRCPSEDQIQSYSYGAVDEGKRDFLESHLALCDSCRHSFLRIQNSLREPDAR